MMSVQVGVICTYVGIHLLGKHEECVRREGAGHLVVEGTMKRRVRMLRPWDVKF